MENLVLRWPCRRAECKKPATKGYACCSKKCRSIVGSCKIEDCTNAPEPCISKGSTYYSDNCRKHGGIREWDYDGKDNYPDRLAAYFIEKN